MSTWMQLIDSQKFHSVLSWTTFFREQRAKCRFLVSQGHVHKWQRAMVVPGHFSGGMCSWTWTPTPVCHGTSQARCFQLWGELLLTDQGFLKAKVSNWHLSQSSYALHRLWYMKSHAWPLEHCQRHHLLATANTSTRYIKALGAMV